MAARWLRATRGTLAAVIALTKNKPGRLVASTLDPDLAKHRLYIEVAGALRGLAWHDEIGSGTGGGTSGNLITAPTISGATSASAGQSVTLTASGSAFIWGGSTGITYRWTHNGTTTDSNTLSIPAGDSASVIARDGNGNTSPSASITVAISANAAPATPTAVTNLPATVTRGSTYPVSYLSTDPDDDAVTLSIVNCVGCTAASATSVTVAAGATTLSYDVIATDSHGLASAALIVTRSGSNIVNPTGSSGALAPGQTHVVQIPDGATTLTLTGHGGAGKKYIANGSSYSTSFLTKNDAGSPLVSWPTYGSPTYNSFQVAGYWTFIGSMTSSSISAARLSDFYAAYPAYVGALTKDSGGYGGKYILIEAVTSSVSSSGDQGAATTVSGAATASFAGAAAGVTTAPVNTTQVKSLAAGYNRDVTIVIPDAGAMTADWS